MTDQSPREVARQIAAKCAGVGILRIMEVCGTHTVSLYRHGIKAMLPDNLRLISGPGCPVCVSAQGYIDAACGLARRPGVVVCSYGDMMRVPGRTGTLQGRRAEGADVRVVYSALDAVEAAKTQPDREVVFIAIGFETTVAGHAAAVLTAQEQDLRNFSLLTAQKRVVPAMLALLAAGDVPIDGFVCPGHVSVIIGSKAYMEVVERYHKPCVVAGFEPVQMLSALLLLVEQTIAGEARLENVYPQAVEDDGNRVARRMIEEVFEPAAAAWRAIGSIPDSGLVLRESYRRFDALERFQLTIGPDYDPPGCRCGDVIQGKVAPEDCTLFGDSCTPTRPVGPCMVSSEGTCAAAFKYGGGSQPSRGRQKPGQVSWAPRN